MLLPWQQSKGTDRQFWMQLWGAVEIQLNTGHYSMLVRMAGWQLNCWEKWLAGSIKKIYSETFFRITGNSNVQKDALRAPVRLANCTVQERALTAKVTDKIWFRIEHGCGMIMRHKKMTLSPLSIQNTKDTSEQLPLLHYLQT